MTGSAFVAGHEIRRRADGRDVYADTGELAIGPGAVERPCWYCGKLGVELDLPDPAWSGDGEPVRRRVDACIADLVRALNQGPTTATRTSCCGHGRRDGWILLRDGRRLALLACLGRQQSAPKSCL